MKPASVWQISLLTSREAEEAALELLAAVSSQPASSYEDLDSGTCQVSVYLTGTTAGWPDMRRTILAGIEPHSSLRFEPRSG